MRLVTWMKNLLVCMHKCLLSVTHYLTPCNVKIINSHSHLLSLEFYKFYKNPTCMRYDNFVEWANPINQASLKCDKLLRNSSIGKLLLWINLSWDILHSLKIDQLRYAMWMQSPCEYPLKKRAIVLVTSQKDARLHNSFLYECAVNVVSYLLVTSSKLGMKWTPLAIDTSFRFFLLNT